MEDTFSFGVWGKSSEELLHSKFPMHRACRDGDISALSDLLLSSAEDQQDLFTEDKFYGWTPAHWSAYYGKLECLQKLVLAGISFDVATEQFNQTPTHVAAFGNQPHCLRWLLQNGTVLNRRDYLGETAMHKAARSGSLECLDLLQSSGAIPSVPNNNGHTALDLAVTCGHHLCVNYLQPIMNSEADQWRSNNQMLSTSTDAQFNGPAGFNYQNGQMNSHCGQMNGLSGRMNGLSGQMNGLSGQMNGLSGQMNGLSGQVDGQSGPCHRKRTMMDETNDGAKKARVDDSPLPLQFTDIVVPSTHVVDQTAPLQVNSSVPNTNGTYAHSMLDVNSNSEMNDMQVDTDETQDESCFGDDLQKPNLKPPLDRRSSPISSLVEHQKSIEQAQGYESVVYDSLYGGTPFCHAY